ncbi:MAG: toll/interleukin-1 receptor domain-containing protein [Saprospiraceae bacterium]|nr:toll/interleukin-1 receptor domain-containing protein [Saprospiraceae bacterium]MDW8483080.1 hypothetical protein [Saprospiraceae bacterium]
MLRVYLSYDQADKEYLQSLLRWLRPLEQKYGLHIWHPPLEKTKESQLPVSSEMLNALEMAHLYLFLASPNSAKSERVQKEEIPRALKRRAEVGAELIRLFRIPLPGSSTGSAAFNLIPALENANRIEDWKNDALAYEFLTKDLERNIAELKRLWMEEEHRTNLLLGSLHELKPLAQETTLKPIPGWLSLSFLLAILYMVTSVYFSECAPRRYHGYPTKEFVPYVPAQQPYQRENPIRPPQPVPLRPE